MQEREADPASFLRIGKFLPLSLPPSGSSQGRRVDLGGPVKDTICVGGPGYWVPEAKIFSPITMVLAIFEH